MEVLLVIVPRRPEPPGPMKCERGRLPAELPLRCVRRHQRVAGPPPARLEQRLEPPGEIIGPQEHPRVLSEDGVHLGEQRALTLDGCALVLASARRSRAPSPLAAARRPPAVAFRTHPAAARRFASKPVGLASGRWWPPAGRRATPGRGVACPSAATDRGPPWACWGSSAQALRRRKPPARPAGCAPLAPGRERGGDRGFGRKGLAARTSAP